MAGASVKTTFFLQLAQATHLLFCNSPNRRTSQSGFLQEHKARLALEIASLRRQAEAFNSPSTYVKCAKFQRLANAKEKELSALQASGGVSVQDRLDAAVAACKVRFVVGCLVGCCFARAR